MVVQGLWLSMLEWCNLQHPLHARTKRKLMQEIYFQGYIFSFCNSKASKCHLLVWKWQLASELERKWWDFLLGCFHFRVLKHVYAIKTFEEKQIQFTFVSHQAFWLCLRVIWKHIQGYFDKDILKCIQCKDLLFYQK